MIEAEKFLQVVALYEGGTGRNYHGGGHGDRKRGVEGSHGRVAILLVRASRGCVGFWVEILGRIQLWVRYLTRIMEVSQKI